MADQISRARTSWRRIVGRGAMIIFAAAAGRLEAGQRYMPDRRIAVAHLKVDAARPRARVVDELVKQCARSAPLPGSNREQQQFGFVGNRAAAKSRHFIGRRRSRDISETPAIGRIPAHCERVQASPNVVERRFP